tara:strand:- start:642 stop:872 length:231 start_codon:yes stop_codon:yes gene_type:complete
LEILCNESIDVLEKIKIEVYGMVWTIISEILVVGFVVFLFVASSVLAWEKQERKYKKRKNLNSKNWGGEPFQGNKK